MEQESDTDVESDSSDSNQDVSDSEKTTSDPYAKIRSELADMTFEELLLLKERLGTKAYNEAMFPQTKKRKAGSREQYKRENKNRPTEVSSKIRTAKVRSVVPVKKKMIRDPRFDDLSGNYNETYFNQAYEFLSDVKQREKQKLVKSLKKEKDDKKRKRIENLLTKMAQKEKAEGVKEERQQREKERRKKERELVAKGKKPFFLKKSEKKKLELQEKHNKLEKSGQLNKYLKKQSKKALAKDRKNLSFL